MTGLCECGCGLPTRLAPRNSNRDGWVKGQPHRFRLGHFSKVKQNRGTAVPGSYAYVLVNGSKQRMHISVVVAARRGKPLPVGAEVHHVNGNKRDNRPSNLVVCQDRAYHVLLHQRQRALDACGDASWRQCGYCHQFEDPAKLYIRPTLACHKPCQLEYMKRRSALKAAAFYTKRTQAAEVAA